MKISFFLLPLLFFATSAIGIDIQATGVWNPAIGSQDLSPGSGRNLKSACKSSPDATALTISNATGKEWKVSVRKSGASWPSGLTLYVRRTTHGDGTGKISGGTSFIPINAFDTGFFSGWNDRTAIKCQYKLEGMSLDIPPGIYGFLVIYTVTD